MKRIFGIAAGAALLAAIAAAQSSDQMKEMQVKTEKMKADLEKMLVTSKVVGAGGGVMGRTVKGAPYSGQEVNEFTQTLGDGTRIHNETRSNVYRDGEGRVRRETGDQVMIWDPVANANYVLDTKKMTAFKMPMPMISAAFTRGMKVEGDVIALPPLAAARTLEGSIGEVSVKDGMVTYTKDGKTITEPIGPDGAFASEDGKVRATFKQVGPGGAGFGGTISSYSVQEGSATGGELVRHGEFNTLLPPPAIAFAGTPALTGFVGAVPVDAKKEDLGEQVIEGVKSRGTRITSTIEAGKIGNDRPLTTVNERWYSEELQTEVKSRRTDPRSGEQIFRLLNVNRSEPGSYLFQVPSGYTLNERK